ncbi:autotransporter assembly complex family protein [Pelagerythrobacter sp.]|uniref:autotransporter assembly complex protein TamA n=1 Tax=Pelagerythrobacter sp. TaxID=2800702 RepID=UPI0035AE9001
MALAALALSASPQALAAQDQPAEQSLEDLIPDAAVENPESWAQQGVEPAARDAADQIADIDLDARLPDDPAITVPWPDELEIAEPEPLPREEGIEFAEFEDEDDPADALADAAVVTLGPELSLGFPDDEESFPMREEFAERFESLSTIEELQDADDDDSIAQLAARARQDEELLGELLRVYGYYDAQVIRTVGGIRPRRDDAQRSPNVRFDILPGPRYAFGAIDLARLSEARDYDSLRAAFEIQPGDPLSSDAIVQEQFDLDLALGETGYPFAEIDEPELLIDHARAEGDLTLPVRPNGKYAFGEIVSSMPDFLSSEHLQTIARFDPGDVYKRSLELDLRRAIIATGLVSSVTITRRNAAPPTGEELGEVALDVDMTKARLRTIAGAIGYGSEEGFRVEASWEHRNLFPPEGALRVRAIAGTQEQLAGITFRRNNFGGRDRVLNLDAYASTIDSPAFDAQTAAFVATFERSSTLLFQKPISWSIGFEAVATRERPPVTDDSPPQPRETYFIGAIPGYVQLDTTNDLLDPTEGFRVSARLSPEVSRNNGRQSVYLRSQFDASYYQQVSEQVVVAGRARFGTIPGTAIDNIAPSRRFYGGGGGSVRGYGYRMIGPRDENGDPTGGRSLAEVALEARIRTGFFDGALSVVPFIDAGTVSTSTTPDFETFRVGAGLGVRYQTGFGPIRIDVGAPLNPGPDDSPVAVYVSLGQAF